MDAIVSYHPEFAGTLYSFKDRPSSISSTFHKRNVEALGHLYKRYEICSVTSSGQVFSCPDFYHCINSTECSSNGFFGRRPYYWWGIGVGALFLFGLILYLIIRRRRRLQQARAGIATMSAPAPAQPPPFSPTGYGHDGMYGYPVPMEPLYSTSASPTTPGYSKNSGVLYAPPNTPPPIRSTAPIPIVGSGGSNGTEQDAHGHSHPPEYTPSDHFNNKQ